jgi:serine O-acetyltransferase
MKLQQSIKVLFVWPHYICYRFSLNRKIINEDISVWKKNFNNTIPNSLTYLLINDPCFRTVFYYRLQSNNNLLIKILTYLCKILMRPQVCLYITTKEIGPGLFFLHGFATIVSAKSIGNNCWINQQVTIGYTTPEGAPVIGNNVRIYAGAKILGDIKIGNNVIIGANAVVVKNIPDNCTVVGVPAYIIKRNGIKVKEML